jgi:hypothetical protein
MSDDTEMTAPDIPASIPADGFAGVSALISLIVNERQCNARLRQLKQAQADAEKAQTDVATARAAFEEFCTAEKAKLEKERDALREREVKVHAAEGMIAHREKILAEQRATLDLRQGRVEHFAGGMMRELAPGYRDGDETPAEEVHVGRHDDNFAAGSTLTREPEVTRRPRGRPRRGAGADI